MAGHFCQKGGGDFVKLDIRKVLERVGDTEEVSIKVDLNDIKYRGLKPFTAPVDLFAQAKNRAGVVTLDCTYKYTLNLTCDRCIAPFTQEVEQTTTHTVLRELNSKDDDDYVVAPEGIIELLPLATNDILLSLPAKFLCKEQCEGLCPKCGQDLNTGKCDCSSKTVDPRLAALDKFFDDEN